MISARLARQVVAASVVMGAAALASANTGSLVLRNEAQNTWQLVVPKQNGRVYRMIWDQAGPKRTESQDAFTYKLPHGAVGTLYVDEAQGIEVVCSLKDNAGATIQLTLSKPADAAKSRVAAEAVTASVGARDPITLAGNAVTITAETVEPEQAAGDAEVQPRSRAGGMAAASAPGAAAPAAKVDPNRKAAMAAATQAGLTLGDWQLFAFKADKTFLARAEWSPAWKQAMLLNHTDKGGREEDAKRLNALRVILKDYFASHDTWFRPDGL